MLPRYPTIGSPRPGREATRREGRGSSGKPSSTPKGILDGWGAEPPNAFESSAPEGSSPLELRRDFDPALGPPFPRTDTLALEGLPVAVGQKTTLRSACRTGATVG